MSIYDQNILKLSGKGLFLNGISKNKVSRKNGLFLSTCAFGVLDQVSDLEFAAF